MEQWQVTLAVALLSAIAGVATALVTARYTFLGKLYERIAVLERDDRECRQEVFELRSEMQTIYFINDVLAQKCPEMDDEVHEIRERIARRRAKFAEREAERLEDKLSGRRREERGN